MVLFHDFFACSWMVIAEDLRSFSGALSICAKDEVAMVLKRNTGTQDMLLCIVHRSSFIKLFAFYH